MEPQDVPAGEGGLANCEDLPELRSQLEGRLGARRNPDPIVDGEVVAWPPVVASEARRIVSTVEGSCSTS